MHELRNRTFSAEEPVMVSICSLSFNHEDYIEKCLEGFLEQVCDFRVEIVIYDDASTDRTKCILQDYAKRYPTIFRTFLQEENLYSKGVNPYFAYVLPATKGKYIAFCDGDDYWNDKYKLARQVKILEFDSSVVLTYGRVQKVSELGKISRRQTGLERDLTSDELKNAPSLNTLTTCFRNVFKDQPTSLYIRTAPIGDLMVWAILGYHGTGKFVPELEPAFYRVHSNGLMSMKDRTRQLLMTFLAQGHAASYHHEQGDLDAHKRCIATMVSFYDETGLGKLAGAEMVKPSLAKRMKKQRRRFKSWVTKKLS